ncbi:hypothetical protein [uncultured Methylobacterium sp.]|uniref:hypothetical protein n=1 Tax=uncultured Methylobacterium sp. TaxID=157278 RepID=UPI0035C953E3
MTTRRTFWSLLAGLPALAALGTRAGHAQEGPTTAADPAPTGPPGTTMLTIFLKHDETKTLDQINAHLKETGWFKAFPPPGVEVVSWYVMMGVGQVVTLRFPPERLREINVLVESKAWGGYGTQFYPTYDYRGLYEQTRKKMG